MRTDRLAAVQCNERADDCEEDGLRRTRDPVQFSSDQFRQRRAEIGGRHSQILIKSGTDATGKQSRQRNPTALTSNYAVISRCIKSILQAE